MAIDPAELMSPRERLAYNINMRTRAPDGAAAPPPSAHVTLAGGTFFGEDGLDFEDFLDIVNPLQHLPLVSIAYRSISGDEISAGARVIGGGLYGGPAGAFAGAINAAVAEASGGSDLGAYALATITGDEPAPDGSAQPETTGVAALDAVAPAAGEIEVSAVPKPWVDPDLLPPEPAAAEFKAAGDEEAPRRLVPASGPSGPEVNAGAIPELSEDQVALLLSSVGISSQANAAPAAAASTGETVPDSTAAAIENPVKRAASTPARETPRVGFGPPRAGLGPMKQTYVRAPAGATYAPHAPITPEMRTHMSRSTVPASSADPAWISDAMAAALDKYRNGKVMEQAGKPKGTTVDGSF